MTQNFHGCEEILKKLRKGGEGKIEQRNESNIPKQCVSRENSKTSPRQQGGGR